VNDLLTALKLSGLLLALALTVLAGGLVLDQLKRQISTVARLPTS